MTVIDFVVIVSRAHDMTEERGKCRCWILYAALAGFFHHARIRHFIKMQSGHEIEISRSENCFCEKKGAKLITPLEEIETAPKE
jgi:hypothetical protein